MKFLSRLFTALLNNEEVSDVAVAVALLTSGVVNHYAGDPSKANDFVSKIRELEDRFLAKATDAGDLKLQ